MKRSIFIYGIAGLAALGIAGVAGAFAVSAAFGGTTGDRSAQLGEAVTPALIAQGQYVAILGDCAACHTAPGGQAFAGGLPIATPMGNVFTTNITPDKTTGIGKYTYGDFERAVRRGVTPRGHTLYPAMPYPSYARLSDADTKALYAYFMNAVKPVNAANIPPGIPWPLSMRWPLTYWRWAFTPGVTPATDVSSPDAELARGAYLVEGLGHCGSCHTPRGIGLEEKALTDQDGSRYLAGGVVDNFVAADLRSDPLTGLDAWSESDIVAFLKTGHNTHYAVFGGMSDVVAHSTQYMTGSDLQAIAHYLKSLPGSGTETSFTYDATEANQLAALNVSAPGALDYMNNCAACHLSSGKGYDNTFPALAGNPVVLSDNPVSLINIILNGSIRPATASAPTNFAMPPFSNRLTDQEVADLVSFIRNSWGNHAAPVSVSLIGQIRRKTGAPAVAAN